MVTVLEHCRIGVAPSSNAMTEKSLSLTFFDMQWISLPPIQHLLFYEFPHSKAYFTQTLIPNLKHSLSLALKHFFPLAGNLIHPSNFTTKPTIRYVNGDSVSLTLAESSDDFNYLASNYERQADRFYPLIPQLPHATNVADSMVLPLLAVQITIFPNVGLCVGFAIHHVAGDGSALIHFIKSWALITKFGDELADKSLPFFNRSVIKDPNGLEQILWNQFKDFKYNITPSIPKGKVRATFIIGRANIDQLRKLVLAQNPTLLYVSSFTLACAYLWVCMVKSRVASVEKVGEDDVEHLSWGANGRVRLDPPIPVTYFGNCLIPFISTTKTRRLIGEGLGSIPIAAELIGEALRKRMHIGENVLKGYETWVTDLTRLEKKRIVKIVGSPKMNFYGVDFGLGRPKKNEIINIDYLEGCVSLNDASGSEEGALEVGLCFPKMRMDVFTTIFTDGLESLSKT